MTEYCPVCKIERKPGSMFCENCGYKYNERHCPQCNSIVEAQAAFCDECGCKLQDTFTTLNNVSKANPYPIVRPEMQVVPPQQPQQLPRGQMQNQVYQPYQNRPQRSSKGIIIGVAAVVVVLIAAFAGYKFLWNKPSKPVDTKLSTVSTQKKEVAPPKYTYDAPKTIRPSLYQSTDYIVYFKGSSEEDKELLLTVEVPGFTQKYEQKITLKPQELKMKIRPPLIEGVLKTLNISKEAQIKVTLQDVATQKYLIQDSKPVTLLSKYDMKWGSDDGKESYYQNICAWVTPESPKIKELLRNSINQLSVWSNGSINAIVGYQRMGNLQAHEISYYQAAAIYETMRKYYKVRYNATPITTSGNEAHQRVALPEDVINQKSGLCIETAVTMAAAIEATGMHAMILILPGHAQVAFESWANSGEYYLIETTALTEPDWNRIIYYLDKGQWNNYMAQNQVTVVDIELARKDGIKPME